MHCEAFERRLNDLLDRRMPPGSDEALRAHAASCAGCQRLLDGHLVLLAAYHRPASGVVSYQRDPSTIEFHRTRQRSSVGNWLAASLLIGWAAWRLTAAPDSPVARTSTSVRSAAVALDDPNLPTTDPVSPREGLPPEDVLTDESIRAGLLALADSKAAGLATDVDWNLLRDLLVSSPLTDIHWITRVKGGFQPITESLSGTLKVIRRTWGNSSDLPPSELPQAGEIKPPREHWI